MKERPILFSAPMVRAIFDGRKTQTRRVVKCPNIDYGGSGGRGSPEWNDPSMWGYEHENGEWSMLKAVAKEDHQIPCPYGEPGDRLWVREAFHTCPEKDKERYCYRADNYETSGTGCGLSSEPKWKPSIHMPRWASRINLEITGIRVERLNDISRGDAMAEGCPHSNMAKGPNPVDWFRDLWNSINGPESWSANPFVWVVEFKKLEVTL